MTNPAHAIAAVLVRACHKAIPVETRLAAVVSVADSAAEPVTGRAVLNLPADCGSELAQVRPFLQPYTVNPMPRQL